MYIMFFEVDNDTRLERKTDILSNSTKKLSILIILITFKKIYFVFIEKIIERGSQNLSTSIW